MKVRVLYFAQAREASGKNEELLDLNGTTLKHLLEFIEKKNPKIKQVLKTCSLAINMQISRSKEDKLKEGDTVAILPPVAGG